tara:strand:+ start:1015 stop:1641 length:627 start_codon:yes stop_codon:yes gene_type:complete
MKAGDLIQTKQNLIGEVVGVLQDTIEVYFLVPDATKANGKVWVYKQDWDTIKKTDIIKHIAIEHTHMYPTYWRKMGFKAWDGEIFTRTNVDIEKDPDLAAYPFPTGCDTDEEPDEYDQDFIASEDEAFTFAPIESDFVKETHKAVQDYNKWEPKNKKELKIKSFIDNLELKYSTMDDDKHFAQGNSIDYKNPPMAPKAAERHESFQNK